jgi:hypothetical protein
VAQVNKEPDLDDQVEADDIRSPAARAPRSNLMQLAAIIDANGNPADMRIKNISVTGLAGVTDLRLSEGATITIRFKNGETKEAVVMWVAGSRFGVSFCETIHPETVLAAATIKLEPAEPFALRELHRTVKDHRRPGLGLAKR